MHFNLHIKFAESGGTCPWVGQIQSLGTHYTMVGPYFSPMILPFIVQKFAYRKKYSSVKVIKKKRQ